MNKLLIKLGYHFHLVDITEEEMKNISQVIEIIEDEVGITFDKINPTNFIELITDLYLRYGITLRYLITEDDSDADHLMVVTRKDQSRLFDLESLTIYDVVNAVLVADNRTSDLSLKVFDSIDKDALLEDGMMPLIDLMELLGYSINIYHKLD